MFFGGYLCSSLSRLHHCVHSQHRNTSRCLLAADPSRWTFPCRCRVLWLRISPVWTLFPSRAPCVDEWAPSVPLFPRAAVWTSTSGYSYCPLCGCSSSLHLRLRPATGSRSEWRRRQRGHLFTQQKHREWEFRMTFHLLFVVLRVLVLCDLSSSRAEVSGGRVWWCPSSARSSLCERAAPGRL